MANNIQEWQDTILTELNETNNKLINNEDSETVLMNKSDKLSALVNHSEIPMKPDKNILEKVNNPKIGSTIP